MEKKFFDDMKKLFEKYNYIMKTSELSHEKIYHADIQKLLNDEIIEKVRHGYYQWIYQHVDSDIVLLNRLFPDAVFCMETACFYYWYTDRTPSHWNFSLSRETSRSRINIDYPFIKVYRTQPKLLTLGMIKYDIDGVEVNMYDRDRTVCDILRYAEHLDKEIFNKVILNYVNDPKKNIANLMKYAKVLRVTTKVKHWIGVWL